MKMPYGKFKGREIHQLPDSYLLWIAENFDETNPTGKKICIAADEEYQHRKETNTLGKLKD